MLAASSCGRKYVYNEYMKVDEKRWSRYDHKQFEFEITDTLSVYDMYLNIRNTTDYSYSNLFFFISTAMPDGSRFRDTVECILADHEGKWLGRGLGRIKDSRLLFKSGIRFPVSGNYAMEIEQAMREAELTGISDVGISLKKQ